jgi:hypothetical protein
LLESDCIVSRIVGKEFYRVYKKKGDHFRIFILKSSDNIVYWQGVDMEVFHTLDTDCLIKHVLKSNCCDILTLQDIEIIKYNSTKYHAIDSPLRRGSYVLADCYYNTYEHELDLCIVDQKELETITNKHELKTIRI